MRRTSARSLLALPALLLLILMAPSVSLAADYALDATHTGVVFKVQHLGMSYTFGRFNDVEGSISFDDVALDKSAFEFTVKAGSVDTGNKKRDDHLRGPDFFSAKQFPVIRFRSTKVETAEDGTYELTGEMSLHGKKRSITVPLTKMGEGKDPWGKQRIGFATTFTIKRSDYGMDKMLDVVGDDVTMMISFEGVR